MENTEKEIYFNFSYYALNLLGKNMYSTKWSAISELVANGIDAGANIVRVYINSIDQKKSIIEIFDDGSGMDYADLANKYAYIGRNKRLDVDINNSFMGRKGVGKLAALFLSKKYYILSKNGNSETAWVLDSENAKDSDMPKLDRINPSDIELQNSFLWKSYSTGTMIQLTDVDLTNFASKKLLSLQQRIANFYLLDKISSKIEVAHVAEEEDKIEFVEVKKDIAFKNFFGIFENKEGIISNKVLNEVRIGNSEVDEINQRKRNSIVLHPSDIGEGFSIEGEKSYYTINGTYEKIPFRLEGWIGIHATIDQSIALENDPTYLRNNVYNPNRLRLYVRNKLAIENFLEVLKNTQAFANYIEGEISFDILDDDRLEDISTTNRESIADKDGRISLLTDLVKPIVDRLIRERSNIGSKIRKEESEYYENLRLKEEKEKEKERLEKERESQARAAAEEKTKELNAVNLELSIKKIELENEKVSLENQNRIKDVLLSETDPKREKLLGHELTGVREIIDTATSNLIKEFKDSNEYNRITEYIKDFKYSSIKLDVIRKQFLKLNDYDIEGGKVINIKAFVCSYLDTLPLNKRRLIKREVSNEPYIGKVDVFEFGVLLDNIIQNAKDRSAKYIKVVFDDISKELKFISDTGPITLEPIDKIFELGVTTKVDGTGIGMYLVKEISKKNNWSVSAENNGNVVEIIVEMGERK
ncbi:MAG: ATP-binding protein [Enterococcus durans]